MMPGNLVMLGSKAPVAKAPSALGPACRPPGAAGRRHGPQPLRAPGCPPARHPGRHPCASRGFVEGLVAPDTNLRSFLKFSAATFAPKASLPGTSPLGILSSR